MGSCASGCGPFWVCAFILAATAAFKAISLVAGTGLLGYPHPFLPGTYRVYVWLGLAAEMAVFAALVRGRRIFLLGCFGLSIVFIGYHALGAFLRMSGPCSVPGWRAGALESIDAGGIAAFVPPGLRPARRVVRGRIWRIGPGVGWSR